jgi:hypothetical protein
MITTHFVNLINKGGDDMYNLLTVGEASANVCCSLTFHLKQDRSALLEWMLLF